MSDQIIRAALMSAVQTWADAQTPPIPLARENVDFTPPANGARYARTFLLPVPVSTDTLDLLHCSFEGVLQVTLCMPKNAGNGEADSLCASLRQALSPAVPLVRSGVRVHITRPMGRSTGIQEDDCYAVPVSCEYRADTYPS